MGWIVLGLAVAAVVGAWRRHRRRHARQRDLMLLCLAAGLEFAPVDPFPETAWLPFPMFGRARSGSQNVVWDPRRADGVRTFDFWYEDSTEERPAGARRTFTCAAVPVGFACSRLRIVPRDLLDDVADALGLPEVTVELEAFNERFHVEAEDPRFASAFLDQRMIEAVLRLPPRVRVDVNEQTMLLWAPLLPPADVLMLLLAATGIRRHVPRVLPSLFPPRPARGPHEDRWLQGRWSTAPIGGEPPTPSER